MKQRRITRWSSIVVALVLTTGASAQAPTSNLETAIKELQSEIQRTREEVKALRIQQERQAAEERRARQQAARRSINAQRRTEAARDATRLRRAAKKNADIEVRITSNEAELRQAEIVLAELGTTPKEQSRAEQQKIIAALVIQRNALREKIRRQNNKRACRWFSWGCVKDKR